MHLVKQKVNLSVEKSWLRITLATLKIKRFGKLWIWAQLDWFITNNKLVDCFLRLVKW